MIFSATVKAVNGACREWAPKFVALQSVPAGKTQRIKVESRSAEWST